MTTKINTVNVVDPYDYSASLQRMGSMRRSANGTMMIDYYSTSPKYEIKLQWRLLDTMERATIMSQLNNCVSAPRELIIPDGRVFSVVLDLNSDVTETLIRDATGYKYNIAASFVEV